MCGFLEPGATGELVLDLVPALVDLDPRAIGGDRLLDVGGGIRERGGLFRLDPVDAYQHLSEATVDGFADGAGLKGQTQPLQSPDRQLPIW